MENQNPTSPAHSSLPWAYVVQIPENHSIQAGSEVIALTALEGETDLANAEFIVRACNSHYELLEACKKALEGLNDPDADEFDASKLETALEDAIAKAGGDPSIRVCGDLGKHPEGTSDLVDSALDAFWSVVSNEFPEAKTGDLSPECTAMLALAAEQAIAEWIRNNA